ncbi:recombinase family protein [Curtobacterium sp. MCBA15_001]|uniref:recombinase family protein n=1 Tax=Curtobacterium sp. MCBA15_001 TaxID=1898731 RepID=UPI0034A3F73E
MTDHSEELALLLSTIPDRSTPETARGTTRFVFVGRVSTEEERGLQSRLNSQGWQREQARKVVAGCEGGVIVEEVFDEISRSMPWVRRPNAAELLRRIQNREHQFDAIVVGETKRMFSGRALEDVWNILHSAGVQLWLPDIGRYDHTNISHRLLTQMDGLMGRFESETISKRVAASMREIALRGDDKRWMGGNAPYGYVLTPLPEDQQLSRSAKGYTNTLALDPATAQTVRDIFTLFAEGKSLRQISGVLAERGIPSPTGKVTWHVSVIQNLLTNLTYTGYRIYGKQHKTRVPFDENNPAMGDRILRVRTGTRAEPSAAPVFPQIIETAQYVAVQKLLGAKRSRGLTATRERKTKVVIPLRSCVYCEGKKMEADVIVKSGNIRFRLRGDRSAGTTAITISEAKLEATVANWFGQTFSRRNMPHIRRQLQENSPLVRREVERLQEQQRSLQTLISNLLGALERQGSARVQDLLMQREQELEEVLTRIESVRMTDANAENALRLFELVGREMRVVMGLASREQRARLYDRLGLRLDYFPDEQAVRVTVAPNQAATPGWGQSQCPWRDSNPQPFP